MRRGREGSFWKNDQGQVIAVNLGADYCAEHEWGISGIQSAFGIQGSPAVKMQSPSVMEKVLEALSLAEKKKMGLEARKINGLKGFVLKNNLGTKGVTVTSGGYKTEKKKHQMYGIYMQNDWMTDREIDWKRVVGWYDPESEEVCGSWCDRDFAFMVEDKQVIKEFVEAFEKNDVAIWVGGSGPFRNGGLIVAIASRVPEDFKAEMEESDRDYLALQKVAAKTDIHQKLRAAKKEYYALSPRWKDDEKKEVLFWLNPQEQNANNSGWYSIIDLEQWIEGKGPIPKVKVS